MYYRPTKIGTLLLAEPQIYTVNYEVAAWYTRVQVPAGEYDLTATFAEGNRAYWVMVAMPGTIVEEYTPSLFGGVVIGKGNGDQRVGQPMTYHGQTYAYYVAGALAQGQPVWGGTLNIPLGEGITLTKHESTYGDGRPMTLYGLEVSNGRAA